jgi:hypothetical protein
LRYVAADWADAHADQLFGDHAVQLGQQTMDLALKWAQPNAGCLKCSRGWCAMLYAVGSTGRWTITWSRCCGRFSDMIWR